MKVDKRPRQEKKVVICFWKWLKHKHLAFVTRSTEKILRLITNLGNVPQVPFPQKNFFWLTFGFLRFGFVFADKIQYLINY